VVLRMMVRPRVYRIDVDPAPANSLAYVQSDVAPTTRCCDDRRRSQR
jgi:hypothetical protein